MTAKSTSFATAASILIATAVSKNNHLRASSSSSSPSILKKRSRITTTTTSSTKKQKTSDNNIHPMVQLDRWERQKRENASRLWLSGQLDEAIAEMCRAEAMCARLCNFKRQQLMQALNKNKGEEVVVQKKTTKIRFCSKPDGIIGIADDRVDRAPIDVTPASKIERLLIRSAREFPVQHDDEMSTWNKLVSDNVSSTTPPPALVENNTNNNNASTAA